MSASDIIVKVGADLTGFRAAMKETGGIAETSLKPMATAVDFTKKALIGLGAAFTTVAIIGARFEQTLIETATVAAAFGDDLRRVTDTFTGAISKSLLTMDKLTIAMRYAGATGSSLGWSIEETTAAVAMFANMGLTGEIAGTNLRSAMSHLMRQTDELTKTLEQFGLTYEDISPTTKGFGDILQTLSEKTVTAEHAIKLFGVESGLNMKNLIDKAREGTLKFEEFVQMLHQSQQGVGTTTEMYDRMIDTFEKQWELMINNLSELGLVVFDTFKLGGNETFGFIVAQIKDLTVFIKERSYVLEEFFNIIINLGRIAT